MNENFKECLLKLDHYATYYKNDKRYLLLFTYESHNPIPTLLVRIYNGDVIWIHQIQIEQLDSIRAKSEIKGSLTSFIDMLKQSLDNNQYKIIVEGKTHNLTIVFEFKLTQGVFIKVNFELGGGLIIQDDDSKKVQSDFTFELFQSMKLKYNELKNNKEPTLNQQNVVSKVIEPQQHEEIKEDKPKRILHGDIVMPNKKKRKGIGARLG